MAQVSVCQVNHTVYIVHQQADQALESTVHLLTFLQQEISGNFGRVGMNDGMSTLLRNAALAWDWTYLAFNPPTAQHVTAFRGICSQLEPFLKWTLYPQGQAWRRVARPFDWASDALAGQYVALTRRVRIALRAGLANTSLSPHGQLASAEVRMLRGVPEQVRECSIGWYQVQYYHVRPVWAHTKVLNALSAKGFSSCSRSTLCKVGCWISLFLGGLSPGAYEAIAVKPEKLHPADAKRIRRRSKRAPSSLPVTSWNVGAVATLADKRLVRIVRIQRRVDQAAISGAITQHQWFSLGARQELDFITWHAARVSLRCMVLWPPEAPCERVGSLLRLYWEPRRNSNPVEMADMALLAQAGVKCAGSKRDEQLVDITTRLIDITGQYKKQSGPLLQPLFLHDEEKALELSGRFYGASCDNAAFEPDELKALANLGAAERRMFVRKRDRDGQPKELALELQQEIDKFKRGDRIEMAPAAIAVLHARQRGATKSVMQAKTEDWLKSEQGQAWVREREMLFAGGEGCESRHAGASSSSGLR